VKSDSPHDQDGSRAMMRDEAIARLRDTYEKIHRYRQLPMEAINHGLSESVRYQSLNEYTRELLSCAVQVGNFAVRLGIIKPEDQLAVMYEFFDNHPEFVEEGWGPGKDDRPHSPPPSGS
jgi:hypothetical protein